MTVPPLIASWTVWKFFDWLLGSGLIAEVIAVGGGLAAGAAAYGYVVLSLRLPEAEQLRRMIATRLARPGG